MKIWVARRRRDLEERGIIMWNGTIKLDGETSHQLKRRVIVSFHSTLPVGTPEAARSRRYWDREREIEREWEEKGIRIKMFWKSLKHYISTMYMYIHFLIDAECLNIDGRERLSTFRTTNPSLCTLFFIFQHIPFYLSDSFSVPFLRVVQKPNR